MGMEIIMSRINQALSQLAEQESSLNHKEITLTRAKIKPIRSSNLAWALGGFCLSLGLGAWAVSSEAPLEQNVDSLSSTLTTAAPTAEVNSEELASNTNKTLPSQQLDIYRLSHSNHQGNETAHGPNVNSEVSHKSLERTVASTAPSKSKVAPKPSLIQSAPMSLASHVAAQSVTTPHEDNKATSSSTGMQISQVSLSHQQLADKAIERAEKALDADDLESAILEYQKALRYVPQDEISRRKLAALYYGNRALKQAANVLEHGIKLNRNSSQLRIALAQILLKEKQDEAALNVLAYLPEEASQDYLAMRAGLAQKMKNIPWALQSYQMLIDQDEENGRWWLGLAIAQERNAQLEEAKQSYQTALPLVGLSAQSQAFIRDRIQVLTALEGVDDGAN